jgi:hypothetical protein
VVVDGDVEVDAVEEGDETVFEGRVVVGLVDFAALDPHALTSMSMVVGSTTAFTRFNERTSRLRASTSLRALHDRAPVSDVMPRTTMRSPTLAFMLPSVRQ